MLFSIRNAFRRAESPAERGPRIDAPYPVIHADRRASRTRSLVVIPRQLAKAASAPLELDPPSSRIFRCRATSEPEMRLADVCNPHVKDEHPLNRVASGFVVEGAPDLTGGWCLHVATTRFGQISAAPSGVVFPLEHAAEPGPLVPLSPVDSREVLARSTRSAEAASTAAQRNERRLSRPKTPSIDSGALFGPFSDTR